MKIEVNMPYGYEIDKENSNDFNILFKKIDTQKKWCDFGLLEGYYIQANSEIGKEIGYCTQENRNLFPTKKESEACLALSQLTQWRDKANGCLLDKWCNWTEATPKHCIISSNYMLHVTTYTHTNAVLAFKTTEIAQKFLIEHKDLLKIAMPFL